MSKITTLAIAAGALACAAGAYYWTRGGAISRHPSKELRLNTPLPSPATTAADKSVEPAAPAFVKASDVGNPSTPPVATSPLRAGEILEFAADVAKLSNVANLRLQIVERRNFFGKSAWHLQAFARTENPLRMVFELDDQFDSYSDATTLSSLQYEMHLNERGQKQESIQRMRTTAGEHTASSVTETRVLPGTRDPLGLMQYLRTVDWVKTHEVRGPVYDGHKLYDVTAKIVGGAQAIAVPAGSFMASKIDIQVFDAGAELKDAHFSLYLANNDSRTPVLLEAVMPFATARVALVKVR